MIQWKCISCGATIKGPDHLEGKEVKCPKCKERIRLMAGGETEKSPAKKEEKPDKDEKAKEPDAEAKPEEEKAEDKKEEEAEKKEEKEEEEKEEREKPSEDEDPLGPLPEPKSDEDKPDEDEEGPSAADLLSEVKGQPGPLPAPAEPEKEKPAEKKNPPPPPSMSVGRGLPINLIVGLLGIIAVAVTAYVIYQKSLVSKEQDRTRKVVRDFRDKLDKVGDTVKKAEALTANAEYDKAEKEVDGIKPKIQRLIDDVELELGAAVTEFTRQQRNRLVEDAEAMGDRVDGLLSKIEDARAETKQMTGFIAEREKELADVEATLEAARKQMKDADYVVAQRTLRKAKSAAEDVIDEIEFEERDIKLEPIKAKVAACKARAEAHVKAIEALIKSEEIVQGASGMVKYKGKWMTPEQRTEAMKPPAKPAAGGKAAARRPATFKPEDMEWLIDDMSGAVGWAPQPLDWSDEGKLSVVEINADKMLLLRYKPGKHGKVAIARAMNNLDISSRGMLVVDVENQTTQPVNLCLALRTDRFYESQGKNIRRGMNKGVTFSLSDAVYKCEKDGWQNYNFQIANPNALAQIYFMIYPPGTIKEGAMMFDNVRMVAK